MMVFAKPCAEATARATTRLAVAVAWSLLVATHALPAHAQVVNSWVTWTGAPSSYPLTTGPGGSVEYATAASGSLFDPTTSQTLSVSLNGEIASWSEFNNPTGTNMWNFPATYLSDSVTTLPPRGNFITYTGYSGRTNTLTFSSPVTNLLMSIASLGGGNPGSYKFSRPAVVVSSGPGNFGNGPFYMESVNTIYGWEGNGMIQFPGTFQRLSWTAPSPEIYSIYNVGITNTGVGGAGNTSYWSVSSGLGGTQTWSTSPSDTFWAPNSDGSGTKDTWDNGAANAVANFGGTPGTVTVSGSVNVGETLFTSSGYTITGGSSARVNFNGLISAATLGSQVSATINAVVSGSGGLYVSTNGGRGTLALGGANSYTGGTLVANTRLAVNGTVLQDVTVDSDAEVGGAGTITGAIRGQGLVGPGNSPGILTAQSVDPSTGLDFAFEFSGTAPNYASANASVNDVLRLTGGTPFLSSLTGVNSKTLFLNMTKEELALGVVLQGGFFTDADGDFLSLINSYPWDNGGFSVYVKGDGNGTDNRYNGQGYYNWRNPAMFGWTQSLFATTEIATGNFSGGSPETGRVLTLTVAVPEPSTIVMLGIAGVGYVWHRRRRMVRRAI